MIMDALTERYCRWAEIFYYGAADPGWDDGTNINLVRNHIIYCRKAIAEDAESRLFYEFPETYDLPIPPEAPEHWMADERKEKPFCVTDADLDFSKEWASGFLEVANWLKNNFFISK